MTCRSPVCFCVYEDTPRTLKLEVGANINVQAQLNLESRGQHCGDIELAGYLAKEAGPVPLVLDLRIAHDRVRNSTDPTLRYHLCLLLLVRLGGYIANLSDFYSYRLIGKLTAFLQLQEFCQRNQTVDSSTTAARLSMPSSKAKLVWLLLRRQLYVLRLIFDGAPITSKSHTHPSHSQTSRLLTSSLSLGISVPRATQCMWGM
jgi:hypothetical protein